MLTIGSTNVPNSVLNLTTALDGGGAEMTLYRYLSRRDRRGFTAPVILLIENWSEA